MRKEEKSPEKLATKPTKPYTKIMEQQEVPPMSHLETDVWDGLCSVADRFGTRAVAVDDVSDVLADSMAHEMVLSGLRLLRTRGLVIIGFDGFVVPGLNFQEFPLPMRPVRLQESYN